MTGAKEVVPETDGEGNLSNTIAIEGIGNAKYVYIVAIDKLGNVGETYEVEVPPLVLNSQVNLEAANICFKRFFVYTSTFHPYFQCR